MRNREVGRRKSWLQQRAKFGNAQLLKKTSVSPAWLLHGSLQSRRARPKAWVLEQNPKLPTPLPQQQRHPPHWSTNTNPHCVHYAKPKSTTTSASLYYLKCSSQRLCLTTLPSKAILLQHRFLSLFPKYFSNHISPFCCLRSRCTISMALRTHSSHTTWGYCIEKNPLRNPPPAQMK